MTSSAPPLYYPHTFEIEENDKPSLPPPSRRKREEQSHFSSLLLSHLSSLAGPSIWYTLPPLLRIQKQSSRCQSSECSPCDSLSSSSSFQSRSFFGRFKVGGHRGVIGEQPENSIAAFQKALESGADTIELDVMLTSDKKAVIMHDDTTDRTTNGKRVVENTSYEDIRRLRLMNGKQETTEKVPTLDEALSFVKKNKLNVVIDVKDHSEEMVNEISRLITRHSLHDRAIVSSFNALVPFLIKKTDDRILTGITFRRWAWSTLTEDDSVKRHPFYVNWLYGVMDTINYYGIISMITPSFLGTEMILANHLDISPKLVSRAFHHGFQVVSWTSNSIAEAKFYRSIKVPLLTDLPEVMYALKTEE